MNRLILSGIALAVATSSFAAFTAVNNSAALGANDSIDLNQFGADGTVIADGTAGTTVGGIGFKIYSVDATGAADGRGMRMYTEDIGWNGVFNSGDRVLHHEGDNNPYSALLIRFDTAVQGVGMMTQTNLFADFRVDAGYWDPFPGTSVGFSSNTGNNPNAGAYTGGYSDGNDITEFYVTCYVLNADGSDNPDTLGFGVGQIDVKVVPEPATMATLGLGAAALLRRRRK